MLRTVCTQDWVSDWLNGHVDGRLNVQMLTPDIVHATSDSCRLLVDSAMQLRRYDVCLLPVSEQNLAWTRTALLAAQGRLQTPVLALVRDLKAAAVNDLYELGLTDFVRDPVCSQELRVRVEQLLDARRYRRRDAAADVICEGTRHDYAAGAPATGSINERALSDHILDRSGHELEAFAAASASRCSTSRESFRAAKNKVIEQFERAYIAAALGRHSGNIAMAARAAQKHRRAFWALMRKHQIDAAPYRGEATQIATRDG
jgi:DNA-binding NtrC family response regulator